MDLKELFVKYMGDVTNIALATDKNGAANVRAVSIGFEPETPNHVYFVTFPESAKVQEMDTNPKVSFIPFPDKDDTGVTIRVYGKASRADISLEHMAALLSKHLPEFSAQLPAMAGHAVIFKVEYENAEVSLGMNPPELVQF